MMPKKDLGQKGGATMLVAQISDPTGSVGTEKPLWEQGLSSQDLLWPSQIHTGGTWPEAPCSSPHPWDVLVPNPVP